MKKIYKYGGLAIIAIMFLSSIVAIFLQAYYFFPQQSQQQTQLPNANIINYDLSDNQKNMLKQQDKTLMIFQYPQNCSECAQQKSLLESFVTSSPFSDQLFLEELGNSQDNSTLYIDGVYWQNTLTSITQDTVTQSLCNAVFTQPTFCALQQVK